MTVRESVRAEAVNRDSWWLRSCVAKHGQNGESEQFRAQSPVTDTVFYCL